MKFNLEIKPTILTGNGTMSDAKAKFRNSFSGTCFCYSNKFGNAFVYPIIGDTKYVYGYNIDVYKRGKHRSNKHFMVYVYTFPVEMFKLLNVEIIQGSRTFKIVPVKR